MAAKGIDASHIDVSTDADTKTVTLKGTVPTAAQKTAAERAGPGQRPGLHGFATCSRSRASRVLSCVLGRKSDPADRGAVRAVFGAALFVAVVHLFYRR